ncbi:MAG: hypothetical protein IBX49_10710 [Gammaproteobacteria bacterium]|nr:hypothetical protein [Gammaproteobacteria bacterium]
MITASVLAWTAAGTPRQNEKYKSSVFSGICATCGTPIDGDAVAVSEIDNATFSNHADFFHFGSSHVCTACAWLYGAGKGRPGNFIATASSYEQTVISLDSVVEDKRPWIEVVRELARLPADTPVTGVLTTDVKPRLWPRARVATVGSFGLFVHCQDYDTSQHVDFDLHDLIRLIDLMRHPMQAGFSKQSIYFGLMRDFKRFQKDPAQVLMWETELQGWRDNPAFLPAVLIAGISKEEKKHDNDSKTKPDRAVIVEPDTTAAAGHSADQTQFGLF